MERLSAEPDKFNVRATILGHVQRGGNPIAEDRILASSFGVHAVDLLEKGMTNRVVVYRDGKVSDMELNEVLKIANKYPQLIKTGGTDFHGKDFLC